MHEATTAADAIDPELLGHITRGCWPLDRIRPLHDELGLPPAPHHTSSQASANADAPEHHTPNQPNHQRPPTADNTASDSQLVAYVTIAEARRKARAAGGVALLQPYPACPKCGQHVDSIEEATGSDPIASPWVLALMPCGHYFTRTQQRADALARMAQQVLDDAERFTDAPRGEQGSESCPEEPPADDGDDDRPLTAARQPAYDAVYAYIRTLPRGAGDVERNAMIWHAVNAALDAAGVGLCISSHCVERDHILPVDEPTA